MSGPPPTKKSRTVERGDDGAGGGVPGHDANRNIAPYRKEGYDRSPFGAGLPQPPEVVIKMILKMLSVSEVFACYRASHAWVNDAVAIMAEKSKATEDRFACKCAGLQPKIMGKYIDLTAVTHAGGDEGRPWSSKPVDITLLSHGHLPNLRYFCGPRIDLSNLSEGEMKKKWKQESYIVRKLGSHCPLLEVCDLGFQVYDDRIDVGDATVLLKGCPKLRELTSKYGFLVLGSQEESYLLQAMRTGRYKEVCVNLDFHNHLRDMKSRLSKFIDDPGAFEGCITTSPSCYNDPFEGRDEFDLKWIKDNFDKESEDLMKLAQEAGFTLSINPLKWYH